MTVLLLSRLFHAGASRQRSASPLIWCRPRRVCECDSVGQIAQLSNLPKCKTQRSDGSKSTKPGGLRQRQVRLDYDEVQELCAMYKKGASLRDLEMAFGVHRDTAAKHLENHGIGRRLGGPRRLTDKQVQSARKRRSKGESIRSIAESLGIGQTTLRTNLKVVSS